MKALLNKEQHEWLANHIKGMKYEPLRDLLEAEMGISLTVTQLRYYCLNHHLKSGVYHRGKPPKPIGTEYIKPDGKIMIKVGNPSRWRYKKNIVWENTFGKVPKGKVIILLDGDQSNLTIENMQLADEGDISIMNGRHLFKSNAELTKTGLLIAKLLNASSKAKRRDK